MAENQTTQTRAYDFPMLRFATRYMWRDSSGYSGSDEEITEAVETVKRHFDPAQVESAEAFILYLDARGFDLDAPLHVALCGEESEMHAITPPQVHHILNVLFDGWHSDKDYEDLDMEALNV